METWKEIPGFSGYMASDLGRIKSVNYKRTGKSKVLKPAVSGGYLKTMLVHNSGKHKTITVHLMIAITFIGEKPDGLEINHKNGVKTDNRVENLEYCTRSYNSKHSFDLGLQKPKRGELNGNSKLTEEDVSNIRQTAAAGGRYYGRKALAEKYGVSEAHIKDIVTRRRNTWR